MFLGTATSFESTSTPWITEYGYWWNHDLDRKFEVFGKNLSFCYSVHHKSQRLHRGKNQNLRDEKPSTNRLSMAAFIAVQAHIDSAIKCLVAGSS